MPRKNSHDQNFKNLILDYPHQALAFFAPTEAREIDDSARITPLRQEQLKDRLGDRFRELDVPLLVEWPDGRREALLFMLEEESDPGRFSIHRLIHYCTDLSELLDTRRVVPVVIFLRSDARIPSQLSLGSERHSYLDFNYLACHLQRLPWLDHRDSDNLVARLNLPNMLWRADEKIEVYAHAIQGLLALEPSMEKRLKYIDFIDIYTDLDDNQRQLYRSRYPREDNTMTTLTERLLDEGIRKGVEKGVRLGIEQGIEKGIEQGIEKGIEQGSQAMLLKLLTRRFGPLDAATLQRLQSAHGEELDRWAGNLLDARSLQEVFERH
ncbi:DUF4351 domain-containing protein [Stutzerimonas kirkiae]|uniref:DUF4351 domain-containing protein n=1 Tax=Stutzerimonas kirkiae TaxID=2211392 RepID=UPI0010384EF7|nr:DUF4351 domain-containing protein [Stutzerimonas kirkiae]TBV11983.1 hypothetical protein DNK08_01170 [Stutzerimonas kirkiae]